MNNETFWGLGFGRDPKLRAADADREATAERIRGGHAEGRLDTTELQQRLERCYEAKTVGELDELVTDLPRDNEPQSPPRFAPRWRLAPLIPVLIALVAICAVTGHHGHHAFWLLIPLMFLVYKSCWWRRRPSRMVGGRVPGTWL